MAPRRALSAAGPAVDPRRAVFGWVVPAWAGVGLLLLGGCATYNDRVQGAVGAFERGDFASAAAAFEDKAGSAFLTGAEAGMAAFAGGEFAAALAHFEDAAIASEAIEDRAILGLTSLSESVLSMAVNESQSTYEGEGYERVMLHAMLGMTYLALGQPEDVLVEARRVDQLLTGEEELYKTEYRAGGIGHFLSAVAYELMGQPGEAYIDYKRLHEKGVGGPLVGAALVRLARGLGRTEELAEWTSVYGDSPPPPEAWPSVVLIAGLGMGPAKREFKLDVPINNGVFSWAVPKFDQGTQPTAALELGFPRTSTRVRTAPIESVATVAAKNLDDRIAWLAARSAARGLLKRQLADQMRDNKNGQALGFAADLFTIFTERADLRAWRTLPNSWVAARAFVPPGDDFELQLGEVGGAIVPLGSFRLEEGETMFVLARALESGVIAHVVGGERADLDTHRPSEVEGAEAPNPNQP